MPGWFREILVAEGVAGSHTTPSSVVVENAGGSCLDLSVPGLEIYRRRDLDSFLVSRAERAGATVVESKVTSFTSVSGGVAVTTADGERCFSWAVGGDGAWGVSRRSVGIAHRRQSVGLGASIDGAFDGRMILCFPDAGDAYAWIFPRPGGVSVGIAFDPGSVSVGAAGGVLDRFLDRHLEDGRSNRLRGHRYRYPIPLFSESSLQAVRGGLGRRILLVGDAAGVADPLTREGIRYAALSGEWAAASLVEGAPAQYPQRLAEGLAAEMSRARRAARLFFDDGLAQWMVPVCRHHAGIRAVLGDLLTCTQPYQGLRRRLLRSAVGSPASPPSSRTEGSP